MSSASGSNSDDYKGPDYYKQKKKGVNKVCTWNCVHYTVEFYQKATQVVLIFSRKWPFSGSTRLFWVPIFGGLLTYLCRLIGTQFIISSIILFYVPCWCFFWCPWIRLISDFFSETTRQRRVRWGTAKETPRRAKKDKGAAAKGETANGEQRQ